MPQVYPLHSVLEVIAAALVVGASLGSACALALARRRRPVAVPAPAAAPVRDSRPRPPVVAITPVPRLMRVDELDVPVVPGAPLVQARLYDLVSSECFTNTAPMPTVRGRPAGRRSAGHVGRAVRG